MISNRDEYFALYNTLPLIIDNINLTISTRPNFEQLKKVIEQINERGIDPNDASLMVKLDPIRKGLASIRKVMIVGDRVPEDAEIPKDIKVFNLNDFVEEVQLAIGYYDQLEQSLAILSGLRNKLEAISDIIDSKGIEYVFPATQDKTEDNER